MQAVETFFEIKKVQPEQDYKPATAGEAAELEELKLLQEGAAKCALIRMSKNAEDRIRVLEIKSRTKHLEMRELSVMEYVNWCIWLPTAYSTLDDPHRYGQLEWSDYAFDMVPLRVLDIIKVAREQEFFTELEIRTPEKAKIDPALFGRIDETWYLLARWAESDEHLLPLKELPYAIQLNLMQGNIIGLGLFVVYAVFALIPSLFISLFSTIPAEENFSQTYSQIGFIICYAILFLKLTYSTIAGRVKLAYAKKAHPIAARAVAARLKS